MPQRPNDDRVYWRGKPAPERVDPPLSPGERRMMIGVVTILALIVVAIATGCSL